MAQASHILQGDDIMRVLDELKQGVEDVWGSVSEGWQRLRQQTEGALTRFKSPESNRSASEPSDDQDWRPAGRSPILIIARLAC